MENQRCWFGTQKVTLHRNKPPSFLLLYVITNEKTVKLMQIDRLLPISKTSPAETRSNNSGRYNLSLIYLGQVSPHLLYVDPPTMDRAVIWGLTCSHHEHFLVLAKGTGCLKFCWGYVNWLGGLVKKIGFSSESGWVWRQWMCYLSRAWRGLGHCCLTKRTYDIFGEHWSVQMSTNEQIVNSIRLWRSFLLSDVIHKCWVIC